LRPPYAATSANKAPVIPVMLLDEGGPFWTPIGGPFWTPIDKDGACLHGSDPVPLLEAMDKLAERAFELSGGVDLSVQIGDAIRQAFADAAQGRHDLPLRDLLMQRNAVLQHLDLPRETSDAENDACCGQINELESVIMKRSAATADDAVMKLIAVAQVGAEGGQITDEHALAAIADARRFFGVGHLPAEYMPTDVTPTQIVLPDGYAPYMRGPFVAWQRRYEEYAQAHGARLAFEHGVYDPLGSDVDDDTQAKFDGFVEVECDALDRLLLAVAPGPAELAVKMKLLSDGEQWRFNQREGIVEAITADARRFGRHGFSLKGDRDLLSAFTALRTAWVQRPRDVETSEAEDDAFYAETARYEGTIGAADAMTLEGVLAKLQVAFLHLVGEGWSDLTLVDSSTRVFREGVGSADPFQKLLWSATTDLARIAGVNLSEQVA
ncbi:hypothetical protein, partial [uncultured Sphingomonas sp.]|uniref:hypothetical protein n=1 Tax=uncultured Sphingomonas sp. TaxID=158754 RepID=UPI0025D6D33E